MDCHLQKRIVVRLRFFFIALGALCTLSAAALGANPIVESTQTSVRHAKNFTIEQKDGFQIVTVSQAFQGAGDKVYRYALYPRGNEKPDSALADVFVEVPVKRVIALTTTFLAVMDTLDVLDTLVGIGSAAYVNTPEVLKMHAQGEVAEVGSESMKNIELMLALDPELIFTNVIGDADYDVHPSFERMGIKSAITAAYMEETLLGRAEWIKFAGAFFCKTKAAEAYFDKIEADYLSLKESVKDVRDRPSVLTNAPWGNVWYIPSADSYIAHLIEDAGGDYLWEDLYRVGPQPMDFESVYERALGADIWLNAGYLNTMQAIASQDERFMDFKSVQTGRVFSETRRVSERGGNDIWERGFVHPEEILADVIRIFHPEKLPAHEFVYYNTVE